MFVTISAITSITTQVHAQQADSMRQVIPEVMVTATRLPENPATVSRSVTLLSPESIEELQPNDLGQLLSVQQGITVTGQGQNPGMTQTLFMRGTNSNHTLLMIDGVRITDPSTVNDALGLTEVPLSGLNQIELVRGSHSTLYGASCIGGAINLITGGKQSPGFHGKLDLRSGIFGTGTFVLEETLDLNYSWKSGFYSNFSFYNTNTQGLDATVDTVTNATAFKSFDPDNLNLTKGVAKVGFESARWNAFVSFGLTGQRTDYDKSGWKYNNPFGPNPLAWYDGDSTKLTARRNLLTYNLQHAPAADWLLTLSGGYTSINRISVDDSSVINEAGFTDQTFYSADYSGTGMNHDLQASWRSDEVSLIGGAGLTRESMTFETEFFTNTSYGIFESYTDLDSLDLHSMLYSAFVQGEWKGSIISEGLSDLKMIAGLRYNYHDQFGSSLNFEINPAYAVVDGALIFLSFSSGFNAPSLFQLYSPETYYTSSITRGNATLNPETSYSLELGLKYRVHERLSFEAAIYQNTVNDEIEYVYLWDGSISIDSLGTDFSRDDFRGDTYINAGTLKSMGLEFSFHSAITPWFDASGNVNLVTGKLSYESNEIDTSHTEGNHIQLYGNGAFPVEDVETKGLTRRPSTVNLFLNFKPLASLTTGFMCRYVSTHSDIYYDSDLGPYGALNTISLNDYVLFDLLAAWKVNDHFAVHFKIENMFNTKYVDLQGFTSRGTGFYLTLSGVL